MRHRVCVYVYYSLGMHVDVRLYLAHMCMYMCACVRVCSCPTPNETKDGMERRWQTAGRRDARYRTVRGIIVRLEQQRRDERAGWSTRMCITRKTTPTRGYTPARISRCWWWWLTSLTTTDTFDIYDCTLLEMPRLPCEDGLRVWLVVVMSSSVWTLMSLNGSCIVSAIILNPSLSLSLFSRFSSFFG